VVQGSGGEAFEIDRSSGLITQSRRLDREQTSSYQFTVTASNRGHPDMTSSVVVVVSVEGSLLSVEFVYTHVIL